MRYKKSNIGAWYRLGFAAIAVMVCLLMAAGTTWARYRTESEGTLTLQAKTPSYIYLGAAWQGNFSPANGNWFTNDDGTLQLDFMVTNSESIALDTAETTSYAADDQQVTLRVVASQGVEGANLALNLTTPDQLVVSATATPIAESTPLYTQFGPGWVYCFLDAEGNELTWMLEGGQVSSYIMSLTAEYTGLLDTSLLQLQAIGAPTKD